MNIRIITASAGSGKTHRLTQILDEAIAAGRARPEGVVAMTFTNHAAAELIERARGTLLGNGRVLDAHRLLAARIGTVNAVCGALVADFAFELGLSPALRVLDEDAAELEFRRAVARVVTSEEADALEVYKNLFEADRDWRAEVRSVVEAARANGIPPEALAACAERSKLDLDACLGPVATDDLDAALGAALATSGRLIEANLDDVGKSRTHLDLVQKAQRELARGALRWGDWAKLMGSEPSKALRPHAVAVQAIAGRHGEHPRLRADLHALIEHVFQIAGRALASYQAHKRALGVIDFGDQEALALTLLRRPDIRAALAGQIDLLLVDEFQDTSPIQLAVFLELASLATEAIWVGDPKQAIYGFRGTDPTLMDAAIESLTSVTSDGDLVEAAARAVGTLETLPRSYRSRPALVEITSEVFARAFASQGMPPERTRLTPALAVEPAGLGEIVEYWPLAGKNVGQRGAAVAAGVRDLLAREVGVRGEDGAVRPARRGDVAVLCRTNAQCRDVAAAFGALGVPAVVPRTGLADTLEGLVARAGLALWADPRDAIAAAELARILSHPDDLDGLLARVLATPGREAFAAEPAVAAVLAARQAAADLGPVAALDAVLEATSLRALCAAWGAAAQRLANLDALRAHAVAYVTRATAGGEAATLAGLLQYQDELAAEGSWKEPRADSQALLAGEDAITIATWHAAKGLEWPVTILFGLESLRTPRSWGVHVLADRAVFDVGDPLGGRWIRFWPNPYTNTQQNGPVRDDVEASAGHRALCERADREALRVLYVGWTRARDRLVFASQPGKLLAGILATLTRIDGGLFTEPPSATPGLARVTWADTGVDIRIAPAEAATDAAPPPVPGEITLGRAPSVFAPARQSPSAAAPIACEVGDVVELGPRLALTGSPDMEHVGHAVHAFLAADRAEFAAPARLALAEALLASHGVGGCLAPADVVAAATRLWAWCASRFPGARLHREWPVLERSAAGTLIAGTADLVLTRATEAVLIDHKTFPGGVDLAVARAQRHGGQLAAYASAIGAALGTAPASTWIHFPVLGRVVEIQLPLF